jgi:hypothetical protein
MRSRVTNHSEHLCLFRISLQAQPSPTAKRATRINKLTVKVVHQQLHRLSFDSLRNKQNQVNLDTQAHQPVHYTDDVTAGQQMLPYI